jgi:hypothetical protein
VHKQAHTIDKDYFLRLSASKSRGGRRMGRWMSDFEQFLPSSRRPQLSGRSRLPEAPLRNQTLEPDGRGRDENLPALSCRCLAERCVSVAADQFSASRARVVDLDRAAAAV